MTRTAIVKPSRRRRTGARAPGWTTVAALVVAVVLSVVPSADGDTTLVASGGEDLAGAGGALFWSERKGGEYRLMSLRGGVVRRVALPAEPYPFGPRGGTNGSGEPVVVYSRCPHARCTRLYTLRVRDEAVRRLAVSAHGCQFIGPSIERGRLAFARTGQCPERGVWARSSDGRERRISRMRDVCCTTSMGSTVAWMGSRGGGISIMVASPPRRPFAVSRTRGRDRVFSSVTGWLQAHEGRLYWGVTSETGVGPSRPFEARVYRTRPVPRAACQASDRAVLSGVRSTTERTYLPAPAFAIDSAGVRFAMPSAIMLAAPPLSFGVEHTFRPARARGIGRGCEAG